MTTKLHCLCSWIIFVIYFILFDVIMIRSTIVIPIEKQIQYKRTVTFQNNFVSKCGFLFFHCFTNKFLIQLGQLQLYFSTESVMLRFEIKKSN